MYYNLSPDSVLNVSQGASAIAIHACTSTSGMIAWVISGSIWFVLLIIILATDERQWAVGVASFVAMIVAIGFATFTCPDTTLIIVSIILTVLGLGAGFIASRH